MNCGSGSMIMASATWCFITRIITRPLIGEWNACCGARADKASGITIG